MYDVNKFQEAALLFESVAVEAEAPVERRIAAARLHLDCLNRLRRYEEMGQAARRYLDAGFASEDLQRTFERILVLSALHVCHDLEANKAYLEAGDCLLALAREHFDAHGGDVVGMPAAFDNAAAMYDMGGDVRQALQVRLARLRLFAGGPNSDELMLDIALGYERLGDLEKARKFYEIVAQTYPNAAAGKRASDALRRLQP